MAGLLDSLDEVARDTEERVTGLFDRRVGGDLDEDRFVDQAARRIQWGNRRANRAAQQAVAGEERRQRGQVSRAPGIRPLEDQDRLRKAVRTTAEDDNEDDPEGADGRRRNRLGRLARSEPHSTGQETAHEAARARGAEGWVRRPNAKACPLCRNWADGKVRSFATHMVRHPGCTCVPAPVFPKPSGGRLGGLIRERPKTAGVIAALVLLPNPVTVAAVGYAVPGSRYGRYQILRIIADTVGVDPFDVDVGALRSHARLHEEERFRGPRRSPCWKNRNIDFVVHRWLPAIIQEQYPDAADYLLRTSPRWGRKRTSTTGLPLPRMRPSDWSETVEGVAGELTDQYPNLAVDFGPTTLRNARLTAVAVEDMAVRYPAVVAGIERIDVPPQIQMATLPNQPPPAPQPWRYAHMGMTGPQGPIGQRFTSLNPTWMTDDQLARDTFALRPTAFAQRDVDDLVRHEIGHQVFYTWTDEITRSLARRDGRPIWPDPGDPTAQNLIDYWQAARMQVAAAIDDVVRRVTGDPMESLLGKQAIAEAISEYAAENLDELVAEAILQVTVGKYRVAGRSRSAIYEKIGASELAREIVKVIDDGLEAAGRLGRFPGPGGGPAGLGGAGAVRLSKVPVPGRIVSAKPTAATKARPRPVGVGPAMHPNLIEDAKIVDTIRRQAQVPGFEDIAKWIADAERSPAAGRIVMRKIVARMAANMLDVGRRSMLLSPDATRLHAGWYPFAHRWLNGLADGHARTTITRHGTYAATAALSPGADWADNVAWAQRMIEIIADQDNIRVQELWITRRYTLATARWEHSIEVAKTEKIRQRLLARPPVLRTDLIGKRIGEIEDPRDVALVIRGWHDVEPTHQLGVHVGFGRLENTTRPQSTDNLVKAVKVLRDGSVENIDATLGGQKVRSFFNNLTHPLDDIYLDVTGDSHHFGIANGIPWTSSGPYISSGGKNVTETPWSGGSGVGGTYPLVAEATRIATRRFNALYGTDFLPNQFQSIAWEMWRAEFPPGLRTDSLLEAIGKIHTARARGEIGVARERSEIEKIKQAFKTPTADEILEWFGNDLAGEPRLTMTELRKARKRRAKGG